MEKEKVVVLLATVLLLAGPPIALGAGNESGAAAKGSDAAKDSKDGKPHIEAFLGTWRGSSTCTNLEAAPACKNETVIYEVRLSDKPGVAVVKGDKIVGGERLPMGELEYTYEPKTGCWQSEFQSKNTHILWCLKIAGKSMTGDLRTIPEGVQVRSVRLERE